MHQKKISGTRDRRNGEDIAKEVKSGCPEIPGPPLYSLIVVRAICPAIC